MSAVAGVAGVAGVTGVTPEGERRRKRTRAEREGPAVHAREYGFVTAAYNIRPWEIAANMTYPMLAAYGAAAPWVEEQRAAALGAAVGPAVAESTVMLLTGQRPQQRPGRGRG